MGNLLEEFCEASVQEAWRGGRFIGVPVAGRLIVAAPLEICVVGGGKSIT